jgi:acyl-CoA reductase-like NAD-dependent aldehyde dehydrogenase
MSDDERRPVVKTYKLFIDGAFVRSESGRHLRVLDSEDRRVANVPRGSRKDVRDAVRAARLAGRQWDGLTAYNRGQILYRFAEALESRAQELAATSSRMGGATHRRARADVEAAVDVVVHYSGWTDKLAAVLGSVNPIAGPFLGLSSVEPTGVIGVLAPDEPDLVRLVSAIVGPLCAGNVVVVLVSQRWPLLGLHLGEIFAVADVPAGVVSLLSGLRSELVSPLVGHRDVDGVLDATADRGVAEHVTRLAAETVKRVVHLERLVPYGLAAVEPFVEIKSVWHPVGA